MDSQKSVGGERRSQKRVGVVADRIRWVGGASNEAVKKGGASSELMKEGKVSMQVGGMEGTIRSEQTGMMSRNGKPPADGERTNGPATRPFIDPVVRSRGDDPNRCHHPNRAL